MWSNHGDWATVVLVIAAAFVLAALGIVVVFVKERYGYVIQGASFSLSLWLLLGVILMYLLNLAYMFDANPAICGIRRFGTSFVYCVVYAAMLVKSIRLNRFKRKEPGVDLNFAGSWSQTLLFLAFLLPGVFLVGEWLILVPSEVGVNLDGAAYCDASGLSCTFSSTDLTIFMLYAYFLVLVTLVSSMGAFESSKFQHEGKSLFVCSLFSSLILIAWACVYNLAEPIYSVPAIPIGLTADATIILIFMFLPKIVSLAKKSEDPNDKKMDLDDKPQKVIHVYDNAEGKISSLENALYAVWWMLSKTVCTPKQNSHSFDYFSDLL